MQRKLMGKQSPPTDEALLAELNRPEEEEPSGEDRTARPPAPSE